MGLVINTYWLFSSHCKSVGIFNPATYSKETANWVMQAVGQDIGNLLEAIAKVY
jgi:hypothetical protein